MPNDGRTVASCPNRRRMGCAQWCPARTAIPLRFRYWPMARGSCPASTNDTAPTRADGAPTRDSPGTDESPARRLDMRRCSCAAIGERRRAGLEFRRQWSVGRPLERHVLDHASAALPRRHLLEDVLAPVEYSD